MTYINYMLCLHYLHFFILSSYFVYLKLDVMDTKSN